MIISQRKKIQKSPILIVSCLFLVAAAGVIAYDHISRGNTAKITETSTISDVGHGGATTGSASTNSSGTGTISAPAGQSVTFTSKVIPVAASANAAVLNWEQHGGDQGVNIEVRTRNNNTWSDWTELDADNREKDGEPETGPASALILARNIDNIQFRAQLTGSADKPSSGVDFTDSKIVTIDSSKGPENDLSIVNKIGRAIAPNAVAATASPRIISRSEWGGSQLNGSGWTPEYERLGRVIVHHTATTESSNSYADVRAIWHYHSRTLGWEDIGYNYLIDSSGNVFEGRYHDRNHARINRVEVVAGHAYGNNRGTVGISVIGNYQNSDISDAARKSLTSMIGYKLAPYNLRPTDNFGPFGQVVVGHYQVGPTSCPGINIINKLDAIRTESDTKFALYRKDIFDPMDTPRKLRLTKAVHKYNTDTSSVVGGLIESGRDVMFVEKKLVNGKLYLRTEHDRLLDKPLGIAFEDLMEIPILPLETPKYLRLKTNQYKINPIHNKTSVELFSAGIVVKFVDQVTVDSKTYYRSAYDSTRSNYMFFPEDVLEEPAFTPFSEPRWMQVTQTTQQLNPISGTNLGSAIAGQVKFTSKISIGGVNYYRTESDTKNNIPRAIPSSAVQEITYQPLASYTWKRLVNSAYKYRPSMQVTVGNRFDNSSHTAIQFADSITINGTTYYRTVFDKINGNNFAFRSQDLASPLYESFTNPRRMINKTSTPIVNPWTGKELSTLPSGTVVKYTSKVFINNTWFARSEQDTINGVDRVVRLSSLSDIN